jgi:uncharacterized small protein (DUF1192 family)
LDVHERVAVVEKLVRRVKARLQRKKPSRAQVLASQAAAG